MKNAGNKNLVRMLQKVFCIRKYIVPCTENARRSAIILSIVRKSKFFRRYHIFISFCIVIVMNIFDVEFEILQSFM